MRSGFDIPNDKYSNINKQTIHECENRDPNCTWLPSTVISQADFLLVEEAIDPRLPYFRNWLVVGGPLEWPDTQQAGKTWFSSNVPEHIRAAQTDLSSLKIIYDQTLTRLGAQPERYREDLIGQPYSYEVDGVPETNTNLRTSFYSALVTKFLIPRGVKSILDIGGGYGALLGKIGQRHPQIPLYLVDLPNMCVFAHYYLSNALPNAKAPINIHFPWEFRDSALQIDAAINTMSFQHMSAGNLHFYAKALARNGVKTILSVNREKGIRVGEASSYANIMNEYGFRIVERQSLLPWREQHFLHILERNG